MWFAIFAGLCVNYVAATTGGRSEGRNYTLCTTKDCVNLGAELSEQLGHRSLACTDFYKFVCDKWYIRNTYPPKKDWWDQFIKTEGNFEGYLRNIIKSNEPQHPMWNAAKTYHRVCMNLGKIKADDSSPIKEVLVSQGGWPLLTPKDNVTVDDSVWKEVELNYATLSSEPSFYDVELVAIDDTFVLSIKRPKFLLPADILASDQMKAIYMKNDYMQMIKRIVLEMMDPEDRKNNTVSDDISDMLQLEIDIAKVMVDPENTMKGTLSNLNDFQQFYDSKLKFSAYFAAKHLPPPLPRAIKCVHRINWIHNLRKVFGIKDSETLHEYTPMLLSTSFYFDKLCELLEKTPDKVILNYIHWRMVRSLLPYVDGKLKDIFREYSKTLPFEGIDETKYTTRYDKCLAENEMKDIFYHHVLLKYFPKDMDERVLDIVESVYSEAKRGYMMAFNTQFLPQMSTLVRYKAPKKYTNINLIAKGFVKENNTSYASQILAHKRFKVRRNLMKLMQDVQKDVTDDWIDSPWKARVVSRLIWLHNTIEIPAMALQPPFYSKDLPMAYIYGAFGSQIAEHSSETMNRYFGSFHGTQNIKEHKAIVECFTKQSYGEYPTMGEEFALTNFEGKPGHGSHIWTHKIQDALGVEVALEAFQRWRERRGSEKLQLPGLEGYTEEQLFYIGYANSRCEIPTTYFSSNQAPWRPGRTYRNSDMVNMAIMNNDEFSKVFSCAPNEPMNPPKKCKYWLPTSPLQKK